MNKLAIASRHKSARAPAVHKIAFYVRVSSEEQARNPEGSIKSQEERLKATVALKNADEPFGEVVQTYIERALSAKDTNRPELQKMLAAIRRNEITLVMVSELSRLSRRMKDFSEIWELMQAHGCGFLSLRENFDTTTAAGEMVLYTVANIAQFERRQISERVSANIQSRASRGLYNGGPVPLGYKLNPDKHGYLDIEEDQAEIVRAAFKAFLTEGTITRAAKWLNDQGLRYKRKMEGGGMPARLGHFTADNLHCVLRNKAYAGIKMYRTLQGEWKEVKAVWEAIVDRDTFDRVQIQLTKNFRRKRPHTETRYPFLLAGMTYCGQCGERLSGKSAHGRGGKIPYYEHAWSTKRQACLTEKVFHCNPRRILAKRVEPRVWEEVEKLLSDPKAADHLLREAREAQSNRKGVSELERVKAKVYGISSQIEALAERIAALPKSLSAEPFYRQMEKLQAAKTTEDDKRAELERQPGASGAEPASLATYQLFTECLRKMADDPLGAEVRAQIVPLLIDKVEIFPNTFRLHFLVGRDYIEGELASAGSPLFLRARAGRPHNRADLRTHEGPETFQSPALRAFFYSRGSNSACNGVIYPVAVVSTTYNGA